MADNNDKNMGMMTMKRGSIVKGGTMGGHRSDNWEVNSDITTPLTQNVGVGFLKIYVKYCCPAPHIFVEFLYYCSPAPLHFVWGQFFFIFYKN